MRLRLGVRVRVPVGQSVPVRLISYDGEGPRVIPGPLVVWAPSPEAVQRVQERAGRKAGEVHAVPLSI
ncbi:hypothetical protein [Streptomyces sp. SLBN-8D4]|uniref:hypothetical protein n=1 Tax=Streptomyces sp. SLBN-8D4 TaxID=3377728 RepID=UPI003C7CE114